jgi:L,D-transpeptidase catalytic domain
MIYKNLIKVLLLLITITFLSTSSMAYTKPRVNKQPRTPEIETIFDFKKLGKIYVPLGGYLIWVNLAEQKMSIFENNKFDTSYKVLTGADRSPTPTGTFRIQNRIYRPEDNYNLYSKNNTISAKVTYWIPFIGDTYAFHNASWREYKEFGDTKRRPSGGSHGCVNMSYEDVADFYQYYAFRNSVVHITKN